MYNHNYKSKIIVILFLFIFGCLFIQADLYAQEYNQGDVVGNFTLQDMDGNTVSLYDYAGYAILFYFFRPYG